MSTTTQHEFHPDAESLSAFVEEALGEQELGHVLEHLAVCGRCRQVVALAREAADAEVVAGTARHAAVRSHAWWRSWGLALAPAAALAATAALVIYVHVRHVEQSAEMAKVESERAARSLEMVSAASQPEQKETAQAAPAPVASEAKSLKSARSGEAPGKREREPEAAAAMPEAGAMDRTEMAREAEIRREEAASASRAEERALAGESIPEPMTSAFFRQEQSATPLPQERSRQAEAAPSQMRAGSATEMVTVQAEDKALAPSATPAPATANATLEVRVGPQANLPLEKKSIAGPPFAARMATPIHLPSGRPAVSIASAGQRILAIDQAGTLYLSEDSGATWEPVMKQWTGHAVAVRRQTEGAGKSEAPPAAGANPAGDTSGPGAASQPGAVFELLNDQNHVWVSADGKVWTAK